MRVMVYGSNPTQHSGMGLVAGKIAEGLAKHGHDVHYYGAGVVGKKRRHPPDAPEDEQYWLYGSPNPSASGRELFGYWLTKIEPDLLLTNRNWQSLAWLTNPLNNRYQASGEATTLLLYGPPVETEHKPPVFEQTILEDHLNDVWLVPFTEHRYDQYADEWELEQFVLPRESDGAWAPHGTDTDIFNPEAVTAAEDAPGVKAGLGIEGRFLGVFVGENWRRKNIDLLYDAWRQFRDRVLEEGGERPILLVHADPAASRGDDKFYAGWNLTKGALGYGLNVASTMADINDAADTFHTKEYIGDFAPREVVAGYLADADATVLPTSGEAFSLVSLESMACGTPLIQTDVPTLRWLCGDEPCRYVDVVQRHALNTGEIHVTPSVDDLVDQLYTAYADDEWREQAGRAGVERAAEFPWSRMHKKLDAAVRTIGELP